MILLYWLPIEPTLWNEDRPGGCFGGGGASDDELLELGSKWPVGWIDGIVSLPGTDMLEYDRRPE